jgi:hypothetical protein
LAPYSVRSGNFQIFFANLQELSKWLFLNKGEGLIAEYNKLQQKFFEILVRVDLQ